MKNIIEIDNINIPELQMYHQLNETQLLHYFEPQPGIFIAESPNVIQRAMSAGYRPLSFLTERKYLEIIPEESVPASVTERVETTGFSGCDYRKLPVYVAEREVLKQITGYELTRGMLCAMHRRILPKPEELCENASRVAILENVVNPTNVGAIIRSAAALGIDAVLLTQGCADPLYRRASRVSMGTVFQIPWTYFDKNTAWPEDAVAMLSRLGFKTAAMALKEDTVSIDNEQLMSEEKLAIVLGTEGDGLSEDTIADCDYTVKIPMSHNVDSLNVAAASAVAFWQLSRQ